MIQLKRAYEAPTAHDGYRVLVDRLWPRGVSKEKAKLNLWLKEVGPSKELCKALHTDSISFSEFTQSYQKELTEGETAAAWQKLQQIAQNEPVLTLIFASKDTEHNQAVLLKQWLEG